MEYDLLLRSSTSALSIHPRFIRSRKFLELPWGQAESPNSTDGNSRGMDAKRRR